VRPSKKLLAEKIREALSGYIGTVKDSTALQSVRDQVLSALPTNFSGSVDVSQDPLDPTKINVVAHVPLTHVQGTYIVEPSGDYRHVRAGDFRTSRTSLLSPVYDLELDNPSRRTNAMGFRTHLPGRQPRWSG
jgi:hypothetical protein